MKVILEQRSNFLVKVLTVTLTLFGTAITLSQIGKAILEGYSSHLGVGMAIGLFLLGLGQTRILKEILESCLFYQRSQIKIWIFLLPIISGGAIVLLRLNVTYEFWRRIESEGGLFEYGTSLAYILAFIFAIPIARYFYQAKQKRLGFFYYFMAGCFLFVGLEELSWGQHLFTWQSPEFFEAYNAQQETTIHNLVWINEYTDYGYWILGLLGGIAWLFSSRMKHWQSRVYFIPDWYLSSFFFMVFYSYAIGAFDRKIQSFFQSSNLEFLSPFVLPFGEFSELLLGLGFLLFVLVIYLRQAIYSDNSKKARN